MLKKNRQGKFIVLEGIDGAGKDTLLENLLMELKKSNLSNEDSESWLSFDNHLTFEPNESIYADKIKEYLANKTERVGARDNELLAGWFILDRKEHTKRIKEKLTQRNVFCNRYDLSTYAYQAENGNLLNDFAKIYELHQYGQEGGCLIPEVTFFLDLNVNVALERIEARSEPKKYYEKKKFLKEIQERYLEAIDFLQKRDQRKVVVINSFLRSGSVMGLVKEYLLNEL